MKIEDKVEDIINNKQDIINQIYKDKMEVLIFGINHYTNRLIEHFNKNNIKIKGIIDDYKDINFGMYLKVIELDSLIENIPFKIEKINNSEFKKLQQQYFERK